MAVSRIRRHRGRVWSGDRAAAVRRRALLQRDRKACWRCTGAYRPWPQREVGGDYELILVNDGSRDDTWAKILDLANRDPRVVGVALSRNHGHQLALSAGLTLCRGARILIIDADLQDPPELLPDMMALHGPGRRGRLRPARQPRGRDLVQAHDRRPVLPAAGAARGDRHSARQRRFPPDQPPRARRAQRDAGAAPLHPRHGQLDRHEAGAAEIRSPRAVHRRDQVSAVEDDAARGRRHHRLLDPPAQDRILHGHAVRRRSVSWAWPIRSMAGSPTSPFPAGPAS